MALERLLWDDRRRLRITNEPSDAEVSSQVVTFEPPPSDFDPLTASDDLLHKNGFPHRPRSQEGTPPEQALALFCPAAHEDDQG
jgi:hypothetical protein